MFRRYAIVSSADQRDAVEKIEADRAKPINWKGRREQPRSKPLYFVSH